MQITNLSNFAKARISDRDLRPLPQEDETFFLDSLELHDLATLEYLGMT